MSMGQSANRDKIRCYITRVKDLPTLPMVVTRILKVINEEDSSANELARAVSMDQALSANVLKLANSAFYGFSRKISTITEAIVHLGFNVVRCLAVSVSVIDVFKESKDSSFFNHRQFWRHSIGCGVISRIIAVKQKNVDPETALLAGIMHDIGKLLLNRYLAADFAQIVNIANTQEMTFFQAEKLYYDVNHAQIGAWLADEWKIPPVIVEPINYHHSETYEGKRPLVLVVALANALCHEKDIGNSGFRKKGHFDFVSWANYGFDEKLINYIYERLDEELEKASIFETLAAS